MKVTRYSTRQFYSTKEGYVTYEKLYMAVRQGKKIQVKDKKTKTDVTNLVLRECIKYKNNLTDEDLYAILLK